MENVNPSLGGHAMHPHMRGMIHRATTRAFVLGAVLSTLVMFAVVARLSFTPVPTTPDVVAIHVALPILIALLCGLLAGCSADSRSALHVVNEMRARGDSPYPAMYGSAIATGRVGAMPVIFTDGPESTLVLANVAHLTTVYCNESGSYTTYRSDSLGFDNENDWWDRTSLDAVVVGD